MQVATSSSSESRSPVASAAIRWEMRSSAGDLRRSATKERMKSENSRVAVSAASSIARVFPSW